MKSIATIIIVREKTRTFSIFFFQIGICDRNQIKTIAITGLSNVVMHLANQKATLSSTRTLLTTSSYSAVPSGVMISRPCRTSHQSSPSSAIPCVPRDSLHALSYHVVVLLLCDVIGLPRRRFPLTFPWITHFTSSHPLSPIVCPKK